MSKNTVKASDEKMVPFFARFLEEQVSQQSDNDKDKDKGKSDVPPPYTFKFPSDLEDR